MKRILLIIMCLLSLGGCSTLGKMRGLSMEIDLTGKADEVWRCYSLNDEIIKITEENYLTNNNEAINGIYQFKFVGVAPGSGLIECIIVEDKNDKIKYEVIVDDNKFIKFVKKEGSYLEEELPDPIFR